MTMPDPQMPSSAGGKPAARAMADWLCLAAAPTFAAMALATGVLDGGQPDVLCLGAPGASMLSGMALMYLLMSAFHLPPWLRLIAGRRRGARRTASRAQARMPLSSKAV
ncbi:hypothetical protein FHP25_25780 [Vineibacter terrae]|uniref:Uncharacterized protein n=2 Tax=Vineibacter terrae TaxID=2586908 RepID=A0A5C8PF94_9HYPH|nr:hypothetical protein FHP25_25780 [Vineibacter terrae]